MYSALSITYVYTVIEGIGALEMRLLLLLLLLKTTQEIENARHVRKHAQRVTLTSRQRGREEKERGKKGGGGWGWGGT